MLAVARRLVGVTPVLLCVALLLGEAIALPLGAECAQRLADKVLRLFGL